MRIPIIALALLLPTARLFAGPYPGVEGLAARRVPWLARHARFEALPGVTGDIVELSTPGGRLLVRASSANAAAVGLGWYLKYSCHRSMSHLGDNLSPVEPLPELKDPVRIEANARYRYALNYCTYNYTMSFYSWDDWERELDWMALHGVNLMLVANGEEAVWRATLRRLGLSEAEIADFIPGPAYTAWMLMGNLQGVGGPMAPAMIDRRCDMQRRMIARMRSLGIEPLLPGYYGIVPASFKAKAPGDVLAQGDWGGARRPDILNPMRPEFRRVAAIYYEEMARLYGPDLRYFSCDPFHEGGIMEGVDLGRAGVVIQEAMRAQFPDAVWVLQGWLENPRKELLGAADKSHLLVQELFGEQKRNWEIRRAYEGTPFIWCCIDDFGERPGLFGKLQHYADEVYRARTGEFGRYMSGVGIMPEGIDNNPVAYDLVLELAWRPEHVNVADWIKGYAQYRYGAADGSIDEAWALLLQTAYSDKIDGIVDNVLCARPHMPPKPVTQWGTLAIGYDPAVFAHAVDLFASARERFGSCETYRDDLIDFRYQALSNEAARAAYEVASALDKHDRPAFEKATGRFLSLARATDALMKGEPRFRLDTYESSALRYGKTPAEQLNCLRNALMLVTYWSGDKWRPEGDPDYAYKTWAGMMSTFYLRRWELFFDYLRRHWDGGQASEPDFFSFEHGWVDGACGGAAAVDP
jgi:alpha-N-acetylglucosaminidase